MRKQVIKKLSAGLLLLMCSHWCNAQTYDVSMSDVVKTKVRSDEIIGTDASGNVYVSGVRAKVKMYLPLMVVNNINVDFEKYIRKYNSNLELISEKEVVSETPLVRQSQIMGKFKYFSVMYIGGMSLRNLDLPSFMIGDKYYMIVQDDKKPNNNYYALDVNLETGTVNQFTHLMSLSKNKKDDERKVKDFKISFSPDSSLVMCLATYERDKGAKMGVAYSAAVFTNEMKPVFTSNYTLPKASKTFTIKSAQLTNSGQILILGRSYDKKQKDNPGYLSVYTLDKATPKPKESRLKFGGDYVNDALLSLNAGNEPLIMGFYRDKGAKKGFDGIFYASLNENKEVYNIKKKEFTSEFITSNFGDREAKKLLKKESKGKDVKEDGDFGFSEFIKTADGGYMAIAENYYMREVTTTSTSRSGNIVTHTTHTHYEHNYEDLMVFKFNKDAELQTMNKIAKKTRYIDGSPSKLYERDYTSFNSGEDVFLVFNDDAAHDANKYQGMDRTNKDATYIVNVKPDGSLRKDALIEKGALKKFKFNPHKKLQKLSDNKLAFIATIGEGRSRKTMMGSFTIRKS